MVGIEAGWVPADSRLEPPKVFAKPTSEKQTIWGHIRPSETTLNRDAPAGQIATLNMQTLFEKSGLSQAPAAEFYVRLGESNFSEAGLPKLLSRPQLTEGNHLSYALQWIVFALMAFMALVWAVRQEIRFKRMADDPNYRPKVRKKVGDDDNFAEDVIMLSS
jgi:cytochrome oxidase assembly protein ShyY1